MAKLNPFEFIQEVRPGGRQGHLADLEGGLGDHADGADHGDVLASIFFLLADQVMGWLVRLVLGLGR